MTETQTGFAPAPPKQEAITANIGYIIDIGDTYKSDKPSGYYVTPFTIHGMGAGKEQRFWLIFRPEWLKFDFDPNTLAGKSGNVDNIYRQNISDEKVMSHLQGISQELYGELCQMLDSVQYDDLENETQRAIYCEEITNVFREFFGNNKVITGYVLKQNMDKVVDKEGNVTYRLSKYMSIDRYFEPTEANLEKERMRARKTIERIKAVVEKNKEIDKANRGLSEDDENYQERLKVPSYYKVTFDDGTPF